MKRILYLLPLFGLLIICIFFIWNFLHPRQAAFQQNQEIPAFNFPTLTQSSFTQKDIPTPCFLVFFSTWCGRCAQILRSLSAYTLPIYAIAYRDTPHQVKKWMSRYNISFLKEIAYDESGETLKKLGLTRIPEVYLISTDRIVVWHNTGKMSPHALKNMAQEFSHLFSEINEPNGESCVQK